MGPSAEPTAEAIVNSAVMPGLWEEFLFRGILFCLVLQALPARRRIAGISATWAMLITSLLFALGHGLVVDPVDGLTVQLGYVLSTLVAGIFFVWVRERTGSLLPAIVLHNLINLAGLLVVGLQG
ncbi:lysostaphin resistance A-like protein [Actinoalloteichus sp. AHMU CJ021]|uniref:CPBP family intramembrane glutamic endopeptidase n=1 Tax=Actinoalloteichus sp. AHMU CJ021 TaxID=2072503 RepID=UPI003FCC85FF